MDKRKQAISQVQLMSSLQVVEQIILLAERSLRLKERKEKQKRKKGNRVRR